MNLYYTVPFPRTFYKLYTTINVFMNFKSKNLCSKAKIMCIKSLSINTGYTLKKNSSFHDKFMKIIPTDQKS